MEIQFPKYFRLLENYCFKLEGHMENTTKRKYIKVIFGDLVSYMEIWLKT